MADAAPSPQPPALGESLRRQWTAFGEWGYKRHSRWGDETLTSPASWAATTALTITALILFIIGLDRHAAFWDWMSGHRQAFFVLQSIAVLGLGLLCLWLLAVRPLSRRSAQLAAALMVVALIAGLALLSDRANDSLMAAGGTLALVLAWRLTAMSTWGPHIARDLLALSGRIERPPVPSRTSQPDALATPAPAGQKPSEPAADAETADASEDSEQPTPRSQPTAELGTLRLNAWTVSIIGGVLLLIAALALPMFSVSFGEFGSASATLDELARLLDADEDGISGGTVLAWQFGWGTIAYAALATAVGLVGWLNLARFQHGILSTLLVVGPVLLIVQVIGAGLLTSEADAGSGVVFGTSGFWISVIAFAAIFGSLWRLRPASRG